MFTSVSVVAAASLRDSTSALVYASDCFSALYQATTTRPTAAAATV